MDQNQIKNAVITVGEGRGFVVETGCSRYVIAAAHCLRHLPPAASFLGPEERTYKNLLGPLGTEPSIWAEVLFADPVADVAVLGEPDNQTFYEQAIAYDEFVSEVAALPVLAAGPCAGKAFLLSLTNEVIPCTVEHNVKGNDPLWIKDAASPGIQGGMSGSPIVDGRGRAIGVVVTGDGAEGGPQPRLVHHLPGWLLTELRSWQRTVKASRKWWNPQLINVNEEPQQ